MMIAEHKFSDMERRNTNVSKILSLANNGEKWARYSELVKARLERFFVRNKFCSAENCVWKTKLYWSGLGKDYEGIIEE